MPYTAWTGPRASRSCARWRSSGCCMRSRSRLNALDDPDAIGEAITAELQTLIDYHNCRDLPAPGRRRHAVARSPSAARSTEYESETHEELVSLVGEGITGLRRARPARPTTRRTPCTTRSRVQIEGTDEIDESILAVPMKIGDRVTGVIVLSNLGVDQFDDEDHPGARGAGLARGRRVRERAAAAEGARGRRRPPRRCSGCRRRSPACATSRPCSSASWRRCRSIVECCGRRGLPSATPRPATSSWCTSAAPIRRPGAVDRPVPAELGSAFLASLDEPFVIAAEVARRCPPSTGSFDEVTDALVAPMRWEPDGFGALIVAAPDRQADRSPSGTSSLARGIARHRRRSRSGARGGVQRARALPGARRDPRRDLLGGRPRVRSRSRSSRGARRRCSAQPTTAARGRERLPARWGDHVHPEDRDRVVAELRAAVRSPGDDLDLEYRARGPRGQRPCGCATSCTWPRTSGGPRSCAD